MKTKQLLLTLLALIPLTLSAQIAPPDDVEIEEWTILGTYSLSESIKLDHRHTELVFDGNNIYVKGISYFFEESWIKGTIDPETNIVTFQSGQFVGEDDYGSEFIVGSNDAETICDIEFAYNAESKTLTQLTNYILENCATDEIVPFSWWTGILIYAGNAVTEIETDDVTFDFNVMDMPTSTNSSTDGDITEALDITEKNVTLTISPKDENVTSPNRFWSSANGPQLRIYSGTLTFNVPEGNSMTNIVFNNSKWNEGNTADSGEFNSATWTGDAQSVVFSIAGNTQINSIVMITKIPVWQDPNTKVKYNCTGNGYASVMVSPNATGNIMLLSSFTVDGKEYTVTSIGDYAFAGCSGLTSITIPNSVTSIGRSAFWNCSGLTSVTIPNSVTNIGKSAFSGCSSLTSVTIPNSVTSIGSGAFEGCSGLTSITIPNSVTSIGKTAFSGCSGLTSVTIGNSVTSIGNSAFSGCSGLTSITIPNSVTSIGKTAFSGCSGLTSVTIGNSVTSIGNSAFSGCSGLTSITIPNSVTSIGEHVFEGCSGLTSVTIPNSVTSIGVYAFSGCSGLTSVTIPNSVTSIGSYAFYSCSSLTSVISELMEPFAISSVFSNDIYNSATLYVPVGTIDAYKTTNGWKNFKNIEILGGGTSVSMNVTDENGSNLSDKVSITWYDANGKEIGTGISLNGIEDGTELYYSVTFGEELGRVFREVKMHKVVANGEPLTCQLEKIGRLTLEGRISATDIDKNTATVTVKQMLNGKWEQIYETQTNEQGVFNVEVYDDETDITISGDGYLNNTLHRDGFGGNGNVGTIPVSLISGFAIAANITMQKAVPSDETEEITSWTDGLNNIDFTLTNRTKGTTITDFTVQNGNVIIKTGASVGDDISLTAKSKQGIFADATTSFTIAEGANTFDLQLTELGGVDATCAGSSNRSTSGYLYNSNDVLVAKGSYVGDTLSLRHINSGTYTLVSMGNSMLLGGMTRLSDLSATGLSEGTDYVSTRVEVADGEVTTVSVSEVPRLDETQFYYTNNNTYFSANKALVTAGDYLTLQAHMDFKPEYADKADEVMLTIDLPEGCQMVENSVIANRQAVPHTVNGNRVTITLNKEQYGSQIRFCIIPTLNQDYTITAMARFDIDGQVTQPIGTAQFETKGLSLSTPKYAANTSITINGTAKGHSEVSIYDNDVLIGKTSSNAGGSWTAQCELYKPYSHSFHDIYAKIVTETGMELTSEIRQVEYDKNNIVPEKVTMLYYNPEFNTNYNIVFDLINGTTTPSSYYYFPYKNWPNWYETYETEPKDFTFLADFTRNDSTIIKNVNIKVLNSDGTVRTLPATFDVKQNKWVATTKYESSSRLPMNVKVEYTSNTIQQIDTMRIHSDWIAFRGVLLSHVTNIDVSKSKMLESTDSMMLFQYQTTTMESPVYMKVEEVAYGDWIDELKKRDFIVVEKNGKITCMVDSIMESNYISWFWTEDSKMMMIEFSNNLSFKGESIRYNGPRRASTPWGNIIDGFCPLNICGISDIIKQYNQGYEEYLHWLSQYHKTMIEHKELYNKTKKLLNARCKDGSLKLHPSIYNLYCDFLSYDYERANWMHKDFKRNLDTMERNLNERMDLACSLSAFASLVSLVGGVAYNFTYLGSSLLGTTTNFVGQDINVFLDNLEDWFTDDKMRAWFYPANKEVVDGYVHTQNSIIRAYGNCPDDDDDNDDDNDDDDDFKGDGSTPINDPSGYVYEAVLSNRLEGVTATCYQKVIGEDMYGEVTEEAVVWNAADYSQVNPQKTDATGFYRWDVPQGMWQVKYEKEGYETAYSDWLPVPPPQLDVNIGMKQSTPPTVTQMRGYESGITVEMSKYMCPETMTTANITVTLNGVAVKGGIELMNAEKAPLGGESYVSKVKFVPENRFQAGEEVVVTVHKAVASYCGVQMVADHVETVKIEAEIDSIDVKEELVVPYRSAVDLLVQVLPETAAAGKKLHVSTSSDMIASLNNNEVTIGDNGLAVIRVNGELPGGAVLTFSIDGYDLTATTKVKVKAYQKGDVNHDNVIDFYDIVRIIDLIGGCDCIPSDEADANSDGKVDVADIITVISIITAQTR